MIYEVFVPSTQEGGLNITLTVDAESWIAALRQGLAKMGEQGDIAKNVMCDIQGDGSIHVTDTELGRVFKLKELPGGDAEDQVETALMDHSEAPPLAPRGARPVATTPDLATAESAFLPYDSTAPGVQEMPDEAPPGTAAEGKVPTIAIPHVAKDPDWQELAGSPVETGEMRAITADPTARVLEAKEEVATAESAAAARAEIQDPDELLGEVFEEAAKIYDFGEDIQGAVEFVMDLVMSKVPVEAGSILFANINEDDLYFASARGPAADEVMGFRVPMGKGIVGFVAREGQALAVSNASRSPLFFKQIAESTGYAARSIACAPVEHDGRSYGAIEALNKQGSDEFSAGELEIIKYLGARLGEHLNQVIMANA